MDVVNMNVRYWLKNNTLHTKQKGYVKDKKHTIIGFNTI